MKNYINSSNLIYDRTFNSIYIIKQYHPISKRTSLRKKDSSETSPYSNIFIWNIQEKQKIKLFSEQIASTEQVVNILFEQDYNDQEQYIVFNKESPLLNNQAISFRHPKNALLIETHHLDSNNRHLWLSEKQGNGLQKIAVLAPNDDWHLDVGNSLIRILKDHPRDVSIKELPW